MLQPAFLRYHLVGGTSLALQIGHRISVDLDMFGEEMPDEALFTDTLAEFGAVQVIQKTPNILICTVNGMKIDFVNYRYKLLRPYHVEEGIRLASTADIAAMKLNAIAGRGSKKDFIDLYFLLRQYSIDTMMEYFQTKYPQGSEFMVRKSLTYFDDADKEADPILLENKSWAEIKSEVLKGM
jgi:hypothetical protein